MTDRWDLECIDPELGGELWRLDDPDTERSVRERLRIHCTFCAACRLQRAVDTELVDGLRRGELTLPPARGAGARWPRILTRSGVAALAAGLALLLVLPPHTGGGAGVTRSGADQPAIERPLAEEIVSGGRPRISWTALEGATAYEVTVRSVDGDYEWTTRSAGSALRIPEDRPLPVGERFRVSVAPIPAHVAPAGRVRSTFRTGRFDQFVRYRVRSGSLPARAIVLAGGMAIIGGLLLGRRPRRSFQ